MRHRTFRRGFQAARVVANRTLLPSMQPSNGDELARNQDLSLFRTEMQTGMFLACFDG